MRDRVKQEVSPLEMAIYAAFISPNVSDSNMEPANLVDVVQNVAVQLHQIAEAIREYTAKAFPDENTGKK